jgi:hypothetical protein
MVLRSKFIFNEYERMIKMLTMGNLEKCFEDAKEQNAKFVALKIGMKGFPKPEIIINEQANFDSKLAYYQKTYNENLEHRFAKGIKIIGMSYGDTFDEIEYDLVHVNVK